MPSRSKKNQVLPEHRFFLNLFLGLEKLIKAALSLLLRRRAEGLPVLSEWQKLSRRFELGGPAEKRLVLIQADKLLEKALEDLGVKGRGLGEKLRLARVFIQGDDAYSAAWRAHRVRNRLAHGEEVGEQELSAALQGFKIALLNLRRRG